jgi:eukaryotic-like serine/threonine-protein kinase
MPDDSTNPLSDSVLGIPAPASPGDRPERVGHYRILELIGEGGMGEVYRAERREPIVQTVALKVVKLGMNSREVVARFESERQTLALMDHPNIARVLDAGTTDTGRPYFVMDFVAGKPITSFCDEQRLSITDRLTLFLQVCDAINHAHTKAIIHRDIKPSNVLAYLQDGVASVKVIDFGIAKALSGDPLTNLTLNTAPGRAIGTYDCMSPEQVEGSPDIDTRTDVYSLGVLLYELISGAKPFDHAALTGDRDAEMRRIIREVEPPRPSTRLTESPVAERRQSRLDTLRNQLRGELEWIPLKAMRKDRTRRYASPAELARDIRNYLEGKPLLAGPETRAYRVRKFVRRNRSAVIASGVALVLLVSGSAVYVRNIRAEQRRTELALRDAEQQRAEAQRQATLAIDSSNFLANIFRNADPTKSLGADVTVVQAMDNAVKSLDDGTLAPQPLTEAMVRFVIGTTYRALGRYKEALPQLMRARELDLKHREPDDPQVRVTLSDLAFLLTSQGKIDEAEPLVREALRIDEQYHPEDQLSMAITKLHLATLLRERKQFAEAERLTLEALATRRQLLKPGDPDTISAMNNLAQLYWSQGQLDKAEPIVRETLEARRAALPAGHPHIAQSLMNLGVVLRDQQKYADAEPLCREALAMRRKVLAPTHPDLAVALDNLARTLHPQGKLDEAEAMFRECLSIRRTSLTAGDPRIADTLYRLGLVLVDQDRSADAEAVFREALQIQRARDARAAPTTQTVDRLAKLLEATNRRAEADALRAELGKPASAPP